MGMFTAINTATTAMSAQRVRLDVISNNIANVDSTRTPDGGVFRRSRVILTPKNDRTAWKGPFVPDALDNGVGQGVRVDKIEIDTKTPLRLVYAPDHPDAIKSGPKAGYVEMPNVNIVTEMVDMINASRSYEANVTLVNGSKQMFQSALSIK